MTENVVAKMLQRCEDAAAELMAMSDQIMTPTSKSKARLAAQSVGVRWLIEQYRAIEDANERLEKNLAVYVATSPIAKAAGELLPFLSAHKGDDDRYRLHVRGDLVAAHVAESRLREAIWRAGNAVVDAVADASERDAIKARIKAEKDMANDRADDAARYLEQAERNEQDAARYRALRDYNRAAAYAWSGLTGHAIDEGSGLDYAVRLDKVLDAAINPPPLDPNDGSLADLDVGYEDYAR